MKKIASISIFLFKDGVMWLLLFEIFGSLDKLLFEGVIFDDCSLSTFEFNTLHASFKTLPVEANSVCDWCFKFSCWHGFFGIRTIDHVSSLAFLLSLFVVSFDDNLFVFFGVNFFRRRYSLSRQTEWKFVLYCCNLYFCTYILCSFPIPFSS